jgi:hypothetical protein
LRQHRALRLRVDLKEHAMLHARVEPGRRIWHIVGSDDKENIQTDPNQPSRIPYTKMTTYHNFAK